MKNAKIKLSRSLKYNGISLAFTAVFILVIVLFNLLVSALSDYLPLSIDLTSDKIYNLSQETKKYLQGQEKPVAITVLMDDKTMVNGGNYYAQAKNMIDCFASAKSNITVSYIDPIANPSIISRYSDLNLSPYDILVEAGEKSTKLSITDLFNISYAETTEQLYIASSKVEQEILSAILRVTTTNTIKIALFTGHDEAYSSNFLTLLEKNGYSVSLVNLMTDLPPKDADIAFLIAPKRDLDTTAIKKLDDYLSNDGEYQKSLMLAPSPVAFPQPNLDAFLAQWGVRVGEGIVMETSSSKILNNTPYFCIVDYTVGDYKSSVYSNAPMVSPLGRDLQLIFEAQNSFTVQVLLSYSSGSFVLPIDAANSWSPTKNDLGIRPSLVRSIYSQYSGMSVKTSNLFTFAAPSFFDVSILSSSSYANADYLLSAINKVSGVEDLVTVAPKNLNLAELSLTKNQFIPLSVAFIVCLPLSILAVGVVIWLRRKNK